MSEWTHEAVDTLRQLWTDRSVTTEGIGIRLGMSKNAVIGKARRLGLPFRRNPTPPKPTRGAAHAYAPPRTCAWPMGDPRSPDFHFCGEAAIDGKPYCREHADRAYVRYRSAKEANAHIVQQIGGALKAIEKETRELKA